MNTTLTLRLLFAAATLFALGQTARAQDAAPGNATVTFENPEKFTDVKDSISGTDKGRETAARPEIWQEQAKFKERAEKMQATVAQTLLPAARSGNLDQLKAAFGPTAQSCKACHDEFRRK